MTLTSSTNMLGDDNSPKRQGLAQKGMKSTTHEFMNTRSSGDTSNQNMHPASGGVTFHQEQSWLLQKKQMGTTQTVKDFSKTQKQGPDGEMGIVGINAKDANKIIQL